MISAEIRHNYNIMIFISKKPTAESARELSPRWSFEFSPY